MTVALTHAGSTIVVEAPDADCQWLAGFLHPAFATAQADAGATEAVHVRFEDGPSSVDASDNAATRIAFAFDASPIRLPGQPLASGVRLHDPALRATYDVTDDGRHTRILVAGSTEGRGGVGAPGRGSGRLALMRVVREYAHNHAVSQGCVVLHAAAVVTPRGAIAIAGAKSAGKTTLLLRLLSSHAAGYLSNDRLLVSPDDALARGVPTVVALRAGTRALLPDLVSRLARAGDFRTSAADAAPPEPEAPAEWRDAWYFSPPQVCAALGRPLEAEAPLATVILLDADGAGRPVVRRLGGADAARALLEAVLCHRSGHYVSEVFSRSDGTRPDVRAMAARCERLASRVACFAVSGAHTMSAEQAGQMLQTCLP